MSIAVIYQSKYGFSKKYAKWISEEFQCICIDTAHLDDSVINSADTIVFLGGTIAGKIEGAKVFKKYYNKMSSKNLIYCVVGMIGDDNKIQEQMKNLNFSKEMISNIKFFWLKGGFDKNGLSSAHKLLTSMLLKSLTSKKDKTEKDIQMIDAFEKGADLTDPKNLVEVMWYLGLKVGKNNVETD